MERRKALKERGCGGFQIANWFMQIQLVMGRQSKPYVAKPCKIKMPVYYSKLKVGARFVERKVSVSCQRRFYFVVMIGSRAMQLKGKRSKGGWMPWRSWKGYVIFDVAELTCDSICQNLRIFCFPIKFVVYIQSTVVIFQLCTSWDKTSDSIYLSFLQ